MGRRTKIGAVFSIEARRGHASRARALSTAQTLVDRGAQVGVTDGLSQNALHVTCFEGHVDIVRLLLEERHSSGLDALNANGHTALMLASLRGHHEIMRMLVEEGADL